jgi:hypothetical protein
MARPHFGLRTLFAATAAVGALLAAAVVENKLAITAITLVAATVLPPVLMIAAIRGWGYLRSFCLGALIPAGLMCWFVSQEAARYMSPINAGSMGAGPLTGMLYFTAFCEAFFFRVRYVAFAFGVASLVAGLAAAATHWLLAETRKAQAPANEAD